MTDFVLFILFIEINISYAVKINQYKITNQIFFSVYDLYPQRKFLLKMQVFLFTHRGVFRGGGAKGTTAPLTSKKENKTGKMGENIQKCIYPTLNTWCGDDHAVFLTTLICWVWEYYLIFLIQLFWQQSEKQEKVDVIILLYEYTNYIIRYQQIQCIGPCVQHCQSQ